ncbi:MAG: RHS repeat domain-containing protein, partial [Pyrinomonadaceae bacterium]
SNVTSHTDARGVKAVYSYNNDPLNRLQSLSWDTSGFGDTANPILGAAIVTYQYRTKSYGAQLLDVTQLSGATTAGVSTETFGFDSEGRISSRITTMTSRSSYPFVTDYIYDALDRVSDVRYAAEYGNGAQPRKLVHHDYDVASRFTGVSVDGQAHASNFVYNAASQPEQLKVGVSGANQITENYGYHAQTGLLQSQTVARGGTTLLNLDYDYAGANGKRTGQLTKISNNLNHDKDRGYQYDGLGRLIRATGGQNVNWAQRYEYDRFGNRNNVYSYTADQYVRNFYQSALNRQPNTSELNSWLATLQSAHSQGPSQFLSEMQNLGATLFTSQEYANRNRTDTQYVYDLYQAYLYRGPDQGGWDFWVSQIPVNGRAAVRAGFEWSYEFYLKTSGVSPYSPPGGATVARDGLHGLAFDTATNRIVNSGWNYDNAGNQVRAQNSGGVWQRFQYDAANRLAKVKADDNVSVIGSYTYGATNQRLSSEESGVRTYFAWSGNAVACEFTETGGSTTPAWSRSYVYLGARLLSTLTPNGSGGEAVQYHHADRLGTRLVTNGQDTSSFEQVTLPFGTALTNESTGATTRRFTSYERSTATTLDYAINRNYDPNQGRFTTVDPIGMASVTLGNPQSLNLYAYCINDPVNHIDPTGLGFWSFFKKLFKIISKILTIIAIVATIALIMSFFPGSIGAVGKFVFGLITKVMGYLGPLKFARNGITGEVGVTGVNPLGIAFGALLAVGALANHITCEPNCQPKEIKGATPAQLKLIVDAVDDLVNRIKNNKECAKVLGGKDKALKAIKQSTVLVAPIQADVFMGPGGVPIAQKVLMAQTNNKTKTIHLGSNTVLAPDGKMTVTVWGAGGKTVQTVQGPVSDINEISATLAHETAHRTNSKEIVQDDRADAVNKQNDDKIRKACGY